MKIERLKEEKEKKEMRKEGILALGRGVGIWISRRYTYIYSSTESDIMKLIDMATKETEAFPEVSWRARRVLRGWFWLSLVCFGLNMFEYVWFEYVWFEYFWFENVWFEYVWFEYVWFDYVRIFLV